MLNPAAAAVDVAREIKIKWRLKIIISDSKTRFLKLEWKKKEKPTNYYNTLLYGRYDRARFYSNLKHVSHTRTSKDTYVLMRIVIYSFEYTYYREIREHQFRILKTLILLKKYSKRQKKKKLEILKTVTIVEKHFYRIINHISGN